MEETADPRLPGDAVRIQRAAEVEQHRRPRVSSSELDAEPLGASDPRDRWLPGGRVGEAGSEERGRRVAGEARRLQGRGALHAGGGHERQERVAGADGVGEIRDGHDRDLGGGSVHEQDRAARAEGHHDDRHTERLRGRRVDAAQRGVRFFLGELQDRHVAKCRPVEGTREPERAELGKAQRSLSIEIDGPAGPGERGQRRLREIVAPLGAADDRVGFGQRRGHPPLDVGRRERVPERDEAVGAGPVRRQHHLGDARGSRGPLDDPEAQPVKRRP